MTTENIAAQEIDLAKLRELCDAATPGPWAISKYCSVMDQNNNVIVSSDASHEDRAYFAAIDPTTIRALLDRLERAEQDRDDAAPRIAELERLNTELHCLVDSQHGIALTVSNDSVFIDGFGILPIGTVDRIKELEADLSDARNQLESAAKELREAGAAGMRAAADFIDAKAQKYLNEHADNEPCTGAIVFNYGEAGRDYYIGMVELADEMRAAAPALPEASTVKAWSGELPPLALHGAICRDDTSHDTDYYSEYSVRGIAADYARAAIGAALEAAAQACKVKDFVASDAFMEGLAYCEASIRALNKLTPAPLSTDAQNQAKAEPTACTLPPAGWHCTRAPGHDGPCAALPSDNADEFTPGEEAIYQRGVEDGKLIEGGMVRLRAGTADRNLSKLERCGLSTSPDGLGDWVRFADVQSVLAPQAEPVPATDEQQAKDAAREVMIAAREYIEQLSSDVGYGFARPANPHDFTPDAESCSAEEIAAHKAACEAFDKGEYTPERGSEWVGNMHILRAPWGIGSYVMRDDHAAKLIADLDAAIAAQHSPVPAAPTNDQGNEP